MSVGAYRNAATARNGPILTEDTTLPLVVQVPQLPDYAEAYNKALLRQSTNLGRRVRLRISIEGWCKLSKTWSFYRLRRRFVSVSCSTPEQAEALMGVVGQFLKSLDGKWLKE